jgi:hypothetical protein
MATPNNAAAETIVQLQSQAGDIQSQIDGLSAQLSRNQATIDALGPVAEWTDDVPDEG